MAFNLSSGALQTIMSGGTVINPIVQILGSKAIPSQGSNVERYRLLISDGVHLNSFATLATSFSPMVSEGKLPEFTIIKITSHLVTNMKEKSILVITDLEIVKHGSEVGEKIGNPVQLPNLTSSASSGINGTQAEKTPTRPQPSHNQTAVNETVYNTPSQTRTHPIVSLSPYQNNWVIKARVTSKSPKRSWNNARGEGTLFSMDLVDESGEIRATAFKEQCEKFYDLIEENKLYFISKGILKMANKKFTSINNDYEMTLSNETKIIPCLEDDTKIPTIQFKFSSLSSIQEAAEGALLDCIGVCKAATDVVSLTSRTKDRELKKRDLTIVDQSLAAVTVTLWGSQAEEFNGDSQPIVAIKGGKIKEFMGGKTITLVGGSVFQVNPDIPEAHKLRGWFDCLTDDAKFNSLSSRTEGGTTVSLLMGEAISQKLGYGDKADYFTCYATVMHIRSEKCIYKACPAEGCQKKVIDQNTGQYRCEKCNKEYDTFKFRMMLSANVGDFSGNQWVTIFQESAEELLGVKAETMGTWQESGDETKIQETFKNVTLKPFNIKLRAKMETFNDESRLKMTVVSVRAPDYKERCRKLITDIKSIAGI